MRGLGFSSLRRCTRRGVLMLTRGWMLEARGQEGCPRKPDQQKLVHCMPPQWRSLRRTAVPALRLGYRQEECLAKSAPDGFGRGSGQLPVLRLRHRGRQLRLDAAPAHCAALHRMHDRAERSEEHTSELQSRLHLVCRLLLEKKKKI